MYSSIAFLMSPLITCLPVASAFLTTFSVTCLIVFLFDVRVFSPSLTNSTSRSPALHPLAAQKVTSVYSTVSTQELLVTVREPSFSSFTVAFKASAFVLNTATCSDVVLQ